jgi:hypothetical protein
MTDAARDSMNGKGKTVVFQIMIALAIGVLLLFIGMMGTTMMQMRSFMDRGDRFTKQDGWAIEKRVDALEKDLQYGRMTLAHAVETLTIETKRLQLQIDRPEGRPVDTYTLDRPIQ